MDGASLGLDWGWAGTAEIRGDIEAPIAPTDAWFQHIR